MRPSRADIKILVSIGRDGIVAWCSPNLQTSECTVPDRMCNADTSSRIYNVDINRTIYAGHRILYSRHAGFGFPDFVRQSFYSWLAVMPC